MPLVDPVHGFILFTNPKCGGTTLKAWFFNNLDLANLHRRPVRSIAAYGPRFFVRHLRRGRPLALEVPRIRDGSRETEDYKLALRKFIKFYRRTFCERVMRSRSSEDYFRLCVVRNPYDRVVSAYLDKFCGDGRYGREAPYVKLMLEGLNRSDLSFRQFLDYLLEADEEECATHWRRQTYLIDDQRIDAFVRLESLHDEMADHASRIGNQQLAILNDRLQSTACGRRERWPDEDLTDVPNLELVARRKALGGFPPRRCFLTPETRAQIREIYARDFERLPYAP